MDDNILEEKRYWTKKMTLEKYIKETEELGYIDCNAKWNFEFWYILSNLKSIENLKQGNKRLAICHAVAVTESQKYKKEIKRLNNNWNKLEEWLNIEQNISSPEQILNDIFSKLQELKGSDKW